MTDVTEVNEASDSIDRLNALTDGVIAIALTLLVLAIEIPSIPEGASNPEQTLITGLIALVPQIEAYVLSFVVIGFFWKQHHGIFRGMRGHDHRLLVLNLALLLVVSFLPFLSDLLGEYPDIRLNTLLILAAMSLASLLQWAMWHRARKLSMLIHPLDHPDVDYVHQRVVGWTICFSVMTLVAVVYPEIARRTYLLIVIQPAVFNLLKLRRGTSPR